jgi:hypothetical protein
MKLKIKYDLTTKEIISFVCTMDDIYLPRQMAEDEILIDDSQVPMTFYREWKQYVVQGKHVIRKTLL